MWHNSRLEVLAGDKHSSLLGPFESSLTAILDSDERAFQVQTLQHTCPEKQGWSIKSFKPLAPGCSDLTSGAWLASATGTWAATLAQEMGLTSTSWTGSSTAPAWTCSRPSSGLDLTSSAWCQCWKTFILSHWGSCYFRLECLSLASPLKTGPIL
jgi:hypothetical protein